MGLLFRYIYGLKLKRCELCSMFETFSPKLFCGGGLRDSCLVCAKIHCLGKCMEIILERKIPDRSWYILMKFHYQLVNSNSGPSQALAEALWDTDDSRHTTQVKLLWHDPAMIGWTHRTPYRWNLSHRPRWAESGRLYL